MIPPPKIKCPNCKYEGKPSVRIPTLVPWIFWFIGGGIFGLMADASAQPVLYIIPDGLFIWAVIQTIINAAKGKIYCPRCDFSKVIPEWPAMEKES